MEAIGSQDEPAHRRRLAEADRRLAVDPRDIGALIVKGDALTALGDPRAGARFYSVALRAAGDGRALSPALAAELRRAQAAAGEQARRFEAHLETSLGAAGFDPARSSERFAQSLDLLTGRKRLYLSQPLFYLFPGLPQIQFQPRETLPWLETVEAAADDIRAELEALLAEPELFRPYVERRADRPNTDTAGMVENPDWSALYLWKDGVEQAGVARRCPRTLAALADAPLCRVPGRTPSILFSRLKPGARIPPHHGLINTRLICHLPLIVPPGNRFRVGNEVREWKEGVAWAFDDTVEHEARNDGAADRTILIFDVWKPEMTGEERELVSSMFQAIDSYGGGPASWGV
ncbi:MAG: aspartyl/asparaginyl beta-hydroxylase domain-containing protein [Brevundimonas sp.]|uniref:aspartyl/asparaginyl beta-hydroxylase domain-containing protein n=1 Tax=Brevundimonas sp. TaxID=1871086 RepID=UPI0017D5C1A0|nr:aspartyl/asparaginyl beta-hydroxylase domain-containing protein [Brevundimonas sp.]MBA4804958.1 aspartyl/asparaginyl beta-hydroxylase domain-containing protein [Brevundimonas sp.]